MRRLTNIIVLAAGCALSFAAPAYHGQTLAENTERELRYSPQDGDFVIHNGKESFNRPLYGDNTAFRVDAGDRPQFSFYMPRHGGVLRFGIKTAKGAKWLLDADSVTSRYRAGSMVYEIEDELLGAGRLTLEVLALYEGLGLVCRVSLAGADSCELLTAYGGIGGRRGSRNGDIGCESEPVSEFFKLKPEYCKDNVITPAPDGFTVESRFANFKGTLSAQAAVARADSTCWDSAEALLSSQDISAELPVALARCKLSAEKCVYFALEKYDEKPAECKPAALFDASEERRGQIANQIVVTTPDEYINAAAKALCAAADAIWDKNDKSVMHGAVAWRSKYLGWRGPYANDTLGNHDRARQHLSYWASKQNTKPVPEALLPADPTSNLSRNEPSLHSNGDMANRHYDMNLVYIDALLRHIMWTGDFDFAREMWPVIERHFAWERRLFRREFGEDRLPLYEAYAAIWASDDMQYSGGGVAYSTAYNYYHNKLAAQLAEKIGKDGTPYAKEAELIKRGLNKYLWLESAGTLGEYKDLLGRQAVHESAGLWSFYHSVDSEALTSAQALQMSRRIDANIAKIPVYGGAIEKGEFFTLPTSNWMPYTWSTNNVVMAESAHTSLAYWQAGRPQTAIRLFKGCILDSMFMGKCPGNLGMTTYFDQARGESQRDFGDAVGTVSRALVEGLFGIRPNRIKGEIVIEPGLPADWPYATLGHPDINFGYRRSKTADTYVFRQKAEPLIPLRLIVRDGIKVTVNGESASCKRLENGRLEVACAVERDCTITIERGENAMIIGEQAKHAIAAAEPIGYKLPETANGAGRPVKLAGSFNDKLTQIFKNEYTSPRSPYCSLAIPKQGIGSWCNYKKEFEVDDSGLMRAGAVTLPSGVRFELPSGENDNNALFVSQWDNYPASASVPISGRAKHLYLLMAGSTNQMQSQFDNGSVSVRYKDGSKDTLVLRNPETWWPIDQDYFIDDFGFRFNGSLPPRVNLKTGEVRILEKESFRGTGGEINGGAATVLYLPLDSEKELESMEIEALANEVVIGLLAATLAD